MQCRHRVAFLPSPLSICFFVNLTKLFPIQNRQRTLRKSSYPFRDRGSPVLAWLELAFLVRATRFSLSHRSTAAIGLCVWDKTSLRLHQENTEQSFVTVWTYSCHRSVAKRPPSTGVCPHGCLWWLCAWPPRLRTGCWCKYSEPYFEDLSLTLVFWSPKTQEWQRTQSPLIGYNRD